MTPSALLEASRLMAILSGSVGGALYAAAREHELWGSATYWRAMDCLVAAMDAHGGFVYCDAEVFDQASEPGRILDVAVSAALSDEAAS